LVTASVGRARKSGKGSDPGGGVGREGVGLLFKASLVEGGGSSGRHSPNPKTFSPARGAAILKLSLESPQTAGVREHENGWGKGFVGE